MRNKYLLLSFLVPLIVRAIPEAVSFPWPLGKDTVNFYAPFIYSCQVYGLFPVLYYYIFMKQYAFSFLILIGGLGVLFNADPFLIMKIIPPFICGFLGFSIFYFCSRFLEWGEEKSLFCAILSSVFFVSLYLVGNFFRNVFALGFLFLAISETRSLKTRRGFALFLLFTLLCVSSHDVVTLLLFVVTVYLIFVWFYDKWKVGVPGQIRVLAGLFSGAIICAIFTLFYTGRFNFPGNVDFSTSKISVLTDYISLNLGTPGLYTSYTEMSYEILLFFLFCFVLLLPFVLLGYFRCRPLDATTLFLLFATFMPLFLPHSALPFWYRWILMLPFPFAIYASNSLFPGIEETIVIKGFRRILDRSMRLSRFRNIFLERGGFNLSRKKVGFVFVVLVSVLSFTFMVFPNEQPFPYFTNPYVKIYFPTTMQWNSLPISESVDAVLATVWLNWNMPENSCLIAHDRLFGWAERYVQFRPIYEYWTLNTGLSEALEKASAYNTTFVITTWDYDYYIKTAGFNLIFNLGEIEVFKK